MSSVWIVLLIGVVMEGRVCSLHAAGRRAVASLTVDVLLIVAGLFILGAFIWVFCSILAYQTAPKFGRRNRMWGILGLIFGPFALFALYVMPRGHVEGASSRKQDSHAALYEVPKKKH